MSPKPHLDIIHGNFKLKIPKLSLFKPLSITMFQKITRPGWHHFLHLGP